MAFGKGRESNGQGGSFAKYVGIGMFEIAAINPTAKELKELTGREVAQEPVYVQDLDDHKIARVVVYLRNVTDGIPSTFIPRVEFRLDNVVKRNAEKGTIKVIDKYGNCRWISEENYRNKTIPNDKNGNKVVLSNDFRACCGDEDLLVGMLRRYLVIDRPDEYVNGFWKLKDAAKLTDLESSLDHVRDYFKGDFSELKNIVALQPHNKFQALIGVRTADDGKEYQDVFRHQFMYYYENSTSQLVYQLGKSKDYSYKNTYFEICPLKEYTPNVTPTNFNEPQVSEPTVESDDSDGLPF